MIIDIIFLLYVAAAAFFLWCHGKRTSKELADSQGEHPIYIGELKNRMTIYYGASVICFISVVLGIVGLFN